MKKHVSRTYHSMPFTSELSFEPLYRRVKTMMKEHQTFYTEKASEVVAFLDREDGILGRSLTEEDLATHADDVRLLMHFVFPTLEDGDAMCKAYTPFTHEPFYATSKFKELLDTPDVELELSESMINEFEGLEREDLLFAYTMLFDIHYDVEHVTRELVVKACNKVTELDRYFAINYSFNYVDVKLNGLNILPKERYARLLIMRDLEALQQAMPLDDITFYGFIFARYTEVTQRENISQLKSELVERDALNNDTKFQEIVRRLRSILQLEDLNAGLVFNYRATDKNQHCLLRSLFKELSGGLNGELEAVYREVIETRLPLFAPDIREKGCNQTVFNFFERKNIKGLAFIPLIENDKVISVLELTSSQTEAISSKAVIKLADLLPVLTIAVRQEMDEFESRIERTIKAHCTALHPSVEWRFVEAATSHLSKKDQGHESRFEDIEFKDVYPLYGSMDIRSSSEKRNKAIQADLLDHIDLASDTLQAIIESRCLPMADYHHTMLQRYRKDVVDELNSGDEISVIEFLHTEVEPFFENAREHEPISSAPIDAYFEKMNPAMGVLYQRRGEYETSVSLLNESLSHFLDEEEIEAQEIFPHYFEKYRTDGVEYNMYVGQSMVKNRRFEEVQLKNLRLFQLKNMCRMTRLAESLTESMATPLKCAPLILAHSAPLTIQFRVDEKQFEVEGSYNVRYEIIKKRIDKSTILGTDERLTQPGMLSVIYTQEKEREEYDGYFKYLEDKGFITGEVEHLLLEDQQGVHGLRALRAKVVLD